MQVDPALPLLQLRSRRFDWLDAICLFMALIVGGVKLWVIPTMVLFKQVSPLGALGLAVMALLAAAAWLSLSVIRRLRMRGGPKYAAAIFVFLFVMPAVDALFDLIAFGKATFAPLSLFSGSGAVLLAGFAGLLLMGWWLER